MRFVCREAGGPYKRPNDASEMLIAWSEHLFGPAAMTMAAQNGWFGAVLVDASSLTVYPCPGEPQAATLEGGEQSGTSGLTGGYLFRVECVVGHTQSQW